MTIEHKPDSASTALQEAIAAHRAGRVGEAEAAYRRVLADEPDNAEAHHMVGVAHLQKGRGEEALASFRRAIALHDADGRYHNNLGNALMHLGRPEEALSAFEAALRRSPIPESALFNRGTALLALHRPAEAERDFRAVLDGRPDDVNALNNLGTALFRQNRNDEAAVCFRRCLDAAPNESNFLFNLANALEKVNDLDGAEVAAARAAEADPESPVALYLGARLDNRRHRYAEARARLEAALTHPLPPEAECEAWFELGLSLDRLDEPDAAFEAFTKANALQSEGPKADEARRAEFLDRIAENRAWFTCARVADIAGRTPEETAPSPIFFVGFPRSGTTLMERIFKAHPKVLTTDESSPLPPMIGHLARSGLYPGVLETLPADELAEARRHFWAEAERLHGALDGRRLVDKMPLNIVNLGFANALFPRAPVVVALRDPRDVCLSCFMQHFKMNVAMTNFLTIEQTARTYAAVMDLWLHYRETLTMPWMEYRYEDLVEDFEGVTRRVFEFAGLGWHEDVARYRDKVSAQLIRTPSYRDVTDALYTRAVGRWRAYRDHLAPILPVLAPFVAAFGYPED